MHVCLLALFAKPSFTAVLQDVGTVDESANTRIEALAQRIRRTASSYPSAAIESFRERRTETAQFHHALVRIVAMAMAAASYRFGPFLIDRRGYRAFRAGQPLALPPQQFDLLLFLLEHANALVTKEALLDALWPQANVTENALTQAISELRQALGDRARTPQYIRTIARRGYRFVAPVEQDDHAPSAPAPGVEQAAPSFANLFGLTAVTPPQTAVRLAVRDTSSLDASRAWTEGWLKIETLDVRQIPGAIADFKRAVSLDERYASGYAGLATAEGALYESTRFDADSDEGVLVSAIAHARRAIELDAGLAESHAALAMLLVSAWQTPEAAVSAVRATALEPWQWRHQFRLCHAAWGSARLEAAARTLALYPAFAFAHFQMAMVYVARGLLAQANTVLLHGVSVQDQQIARRERFPALGLHWLRGLVLLAQHDASQALTEFDREAQLAEVHRLYGREYRMSALLGRGFALVQSGRPGDALMAFQEALHLYPAWAPCGLGYAHALRALRQHVAADHAVTSAAEAVRTLESRRPIEGAVARAQLCATQGDLDEAAAVLGRLLNAAPPGFAAWMLPIDPLLASLHTVPSYLTVLQQLAERAR
jgi:DNA-binding winged helix-turn-helix (wHTH) protein